jgi:ABC-type branched-subunit amino acid transport system ATPase component
MTAEPSTAQELFDGVPYEPGAAKNDPILVADNVRRAFGGLVAVDVEHLEVQRGAITALIGPNGAGKTTFFNLLTNFDEPDTGDRLFEGNDLSGVSAYKVANLGMVRTFQLTKSLSKMTVIDNMRLGGTEQAGESSEHCCHSCGAAKKLRSPSVPMHCSSDSNSATCAMSSPARSPVASGSCLKWQEL